MRARTRAQWGKATAFASHVSRETSPVWRRSSVGTLRLGPPILPRTGSLTVRPQLALPASTCSGLAPTPAGPVPLAAFQTSPATTPLRRRSRPARRQLVPNAAPVSTARRAPGSPLVPSQRLEPCVGSLRGRAFPPRATSTGAFRRCISPLSPPGVVLQSPALREAATMSSLKPLPRRRRAGLASLPALSRCRCSPRGMAMTGARGAPEPNSFGRALPLSAGQLRTHSGTGVAVVAGRAAAPSSRG